MPTAHEITRNLRELGYKIRYRFGLSRHWTAGLPDHTSDPDDDAVQRSIRVGQESIRAHMTYLNGEQQKKGRHAKADLAELATTEETPTEANHAGNAADPTDLD